MHTAPTLIGIGASAGGLEAIGQLIATLDPQTHLSFVVLQHLSPTHKSMMVEILSRETRLQVQALCDNTKPQAGVIYIVPANYNASIKEGRLLLIPAQPQVAPKPSINEFFIALAADAGEASVGIVLSGTGSDGTAGLRAIQAAGGISLVQKPETAKYSGMPLSAIDAKVADFILSPKEIAQRLHSLIPKYPNQIDHFAEQSLNTLLSLLKEKCQVDFSGYKLGTLSRRIRRRIIATGHTELDAYISWIKQNLQELDLLARDILISVTAFFRDPEAFNMLNEHLLTLCKAKATHQEIRIWIAGCATGEEVYSFAILISEALQDNVGKQAIQIFATDIDEEALNVARRGLYPAAALANLDTEHLSKYFTINGNHYEVNKTLRDMIVFARHNLVDDPPFLRLDLISCRNVLIYFDNALQTRVLQRFHFALANQGILFLGRSESVAQAEQLFNAENRKERIFKKIGESIHFTSPVISRAKHANHKTKAKESTSQALLEGVTESLNITLALCNQKGTVLHTAGNVQKFFSFPSGAMQINICDIINQVFKNECITLMHKFNKTSQPQIGRIKNLASGRWQLRIQAVTQADNLFSLIIIAPPFHAGPLQLPETLSLPTHYADPLQDELQATKEHLQSLIEELATANEEMQSLNEEAQASNEELQATNEELEAANEELQATNEELVSLNEEMNVKTHELSRLNDEYSHLYDALEFPIMVFESSGHLKRFNAPASRRFNLRSTAIMQHVERLRLPEYIKHLPKLLHRVLAHGDREEILVKGDGRHLQLSISPGQDQYGEIQSLVVALMDITDILKTQEDLKESQGQLYSLIENTSILLAIKDISGSYLHANQSFLRAFSLTGQDYKKCSDFEIFPEQFAASLWSKDLEAIRAQIPIVAEHHLQVEGTKRIYRTVHQVMRDLQGHPKVLMNESEDITQPKEAEYQLKIAARVFEHAGEAIAVTDKKGIILSVNSAFQEVTGFNTQEAIGQAIGKLLGSGRHSHAFYQQMWSALDTKGYWQGEIWNQRKDGKIFPEWLTINRIDDRNERSEFFIAVFSDISSLKESQRKAEFLATHDPLTQLPNRNLFNDRINFALAQAKNNQHKVALFFIDLDNFKCINDTLGHHTGDDLLKQVATRLRNLVRDIDTVARLGGDEFTIILIDTSLEQAEYIAERILSELSTHFLLFGQKAFVSASIGIAFYPDDATDTANLIKSADTAMYRAKEEGRNRIQLFRPELRVHLFKQAAIETALHQALKEQNLRMVYQPKFCAQNPHKMIGAEALLRWQDATLGHVSPAEFIPVAEKSGLILELELYVAKRVITSLHQWSKANIKVPTIAMNISAYSLRDKNFYHKIYSLIQEYQFDIHLLQIELTEAALVSQGETEIYNLTQLDHLGIKFSLDDFGTGYSSLSYLKNLPISELKIDKSFIDGLGSNLSDEKIIQAILSMAQALDIKTVAEGVETQAQALWLKSKECHYLQGYWLARPLEKEDFIHFLRKHSADFEV
ncbi:two-component system, chemotaxis family, CheB/CheR fusion protein [Allopseudospirillum japonicum]|uniref:Two-component system, chemotaxis family, CheB/CheR fusion protein n=1 Tax=Allopseudospirillum japonicum TaxID=64971 RepID=A0A1H6Q5Q4_9GAMM|nr:EAL domain-containing protein [Allopseudospirillum japonicum]SEI37226.1 two-component system, chemotaxis family, CheB/CheR fusion protein [Allopseudospirillum japonicum]